MRSVLRLFLVMALFTAAPARAQTGPAALEGAWSRVVSFGPNTPWHSTQPGQRIFVDGHYSWISIQTPVGAPRPPMPDSTGTAEQLRAVWGPVQAQAGTYDVRGDTITQRILVAKNPAAMRSGDGGRYTYRMVGDSLWITNLNDRSTGKYVRLRGLDQGGLRGAWLQQEIRGFSGAVTGNQPGFRFYADGHYHWIRANGLAPRPEMVAAQASAAELRAVWGTGFLAAAGTYGMAGDINIQVPMVDKNPAGMAPGVFNSYRVRIAGDTLWSTNHGSQAGPYQNPGTGRYLRVRHRPSTQ
jgi:hypothetical protein